MQVLSAGGRLPKKSPSVEVMSGPKRASLWVRLSSEEIAVIDRLLPRMGKGGLKRDVLELALREYLPMVNGAKRFVQRPRGHVSQHSARRYLIDQKLLADLDRIARQHRWSKSELIRQAILTLGEQA